MSEATSTTTAQRAGVIAHALRALADHVAAHLLDLGEVVVNEDHLDISISGCDAAVWKASLRDGVDTIDRRAAAREVDSVTLTGRLPDTGVRVELTWVERVPAGARALRAVSR
jgi:hypothetical protein